MKKQPFDDDAVFVALINEMVNSPSPLARIRFTQILAQPLGKLLMAPPLCVEQLCDKLESELKNYQYPEFAAPNKAARLHLTLLRSFLRYRPQMAKELIEAGFPVPE